MKAEKTILVHKGKERNVVIEFGRNCIATDVETQFSGNGGTREQALAALERNLNMPDPRAKK